MTGTAAFCVHDVSGRRENQAVRKVAEDHISGVAEITEGLLNHVEVAIRAYDPCLSCATHALGQMLLEVELLDCEDNVLDRKSTR